MTVKRIAVRAILDRMHAHCLTDNKAKIRKKKQQQQQQQQQLRKKRNKRK